MIFAKFSMSRSNVAILIFGQTAVFCCLPTFLATNMFSLISFHCQHLFDFFMWAFFSCCFHILFCSRKGRNIQEPKREITILSFQWVYKEGKGGRCPEFWGNRQITRLLIRFLLLIILYHILDSIFQRFYMSYFSDTFVCWVSRCINNSWFTEDCMKRLWLGGCLCCWTRQRFRQLT